MGRHNDFRTTPIASHKPAILFSLNLVYLYISTCILLIYLCLENISLTDQPAITHPSQQVTSPPLPKPLTDPSTALSLSLPGSGIHSYEIYPQDSNQVAQPSDCYNQSIEFGTPAEEKWQAISFNPEILYVMQDMIKKEVTNYMSELHRNEM